MALSWLPAASSLSGSSCVTSELTVGGNVETKEEEEKKKTQMAGQRPESGHRTGGEPPNFLLAFFPLSVAAVGVTTCTVCVNSRRRLNRLASRRGSLAEKLC